MTPALDRLRRPFDHADVIAEQAEVGVGATVLVQAADNLDDTANMLRVARAHPQVADVDGLAVLAERGLTFDVCAETAPLLRHVPTLAEPPGARPGGGPPRQAPDPGPRLAALGRPAGRGRRGAQRDRQGLGLNTPPTPRGGPRPTSSPT